MNNFSFIPDPDLRAILNQEADNNSSALNCVRIGTVVSFDPTKQSVVVQLVNPMIAYNTPPTKGAVPPTPTAYPIPPLVQVPAFVLCGGSAFIGMPIAAGDTCIVLFNDRDLDPWWSAGTTGAPPNSNRMHSLADGIALVGIRPATNPIDNLPGDGTHVTFGNSSTTLLLTLNAMINAMSGIVTALTALNSKTGPDESTAIAAAGTLVAAAAALPPELLQ